MALTTSNLDINEAYGTVRPAVSGGLNMALQAEATAARSPVISLIGRGLAELAEDDTKPQLEKEDLKKLYPVYASKFTKAVSKEEADYFTKKWRLEDIATQSQIARSASGRGSFLESATNMTGQLLISAVTDPLVYLEAPAILSAKVLKNLPFTRNIAARSSTRLFQDVRSGKTASEAFLTGAARGAKLSAFISAPLNIADYLQTAGSTTEGSITTVIANMALDVGMTSLALGYGQRSLLSAYQGGDTKQVARMLGLGEDTFNSMAKVSSNEVFDDATKSRLIHSIILDDPAIKRSRRLAKSMDDLQHQNLPIDEKFKHTSHVVDEVAESLNVSKSSIMDDIFLDDLPLHNRAAVNTAKKITHKYLINNRVKIDENTTGPLASYARGFEKIFGREVVVVPDRIAETAGFSGRTFMNAPDHIFIRESGTLSSAAGATRIGLLGHEFYHTLKAIQPNLVRDLTNVVTSLPDEAFKKVVSNWGGPAKNIPRSDIKYWEEFMADMLGYSMESPEFWTALKATKNKDLKVALESFQGVVADDMIRQGFEIGEAFGSKVRSSRKAPKAKARWFELLKKARANKAVYEDHLGKMYSDLEDRMLQMESQPLFRETTSQKARAILSEALQAVVGDSVMAKASLFWPKRTPLGDAFSQLPRDFDGFAKRYSMKESLLFGKDFERGSLASMTDEGRKSLSLMERDVQEVTRLGVAAMSFIEDSIGKHGKISLPDLSSALHRLEGDPGVIDDIMAAAGLAVKQGRLTTVSQQISNRLTDVVNARINQQLDNMKGRGLIGATDSADGLIERLTGFSGSFKTGEGLNISRRKVARVREEVDPLTLVIKEHGLVSVWKNPKKAAPLIANMFEEMAGVFKPVADEAYNSAVRDLAATLKDINKLQGARLKGAGVITDTAADFRMALRHDVNEVVDAGFQRWHNDIVDLLDIRQTVGVDASPAQVNNYLLKVFGDLRTNAQTSLDPSAAMKTSNKAEALRNSRQLIFKPGAEVVYDMKYGSKNTGSHLITMLTKNAENGAIFDEIGSDIAGLNQLIDGKAWSTLDKARAKAVLNQVYGELNSPINATLASHTQLIGQLTDMAVLGKSGITSAFTDPVLMSEQLRWLGMPMSDAYTNIAKSIFNTAKRRFKGQELDNYFTGLGAGMASLRGAVARRVGGNFSTGGFVGDMHSSYFKWNGLEGITNVYQEALLDVTQGFFARQLMDFDNIDPKLAKVLQRFDISDDDARALAGYAKEVPGLTGHRINPMDITDRDLRNKLIMFHDDVMKHGVLEPDEASLAYANLGMQAGTIEGSAARVVMKYMNYQIASLRQSYRRIASHHGDGTLKNLLSKDDASSKALHLGSFAIAAMMGTAVAKGVKDLVDGETPAFDDDRAYEIFWQSGVIPLLPELLQLTNLDNALGLDDSQYGFMGPAPSKIGELARSVIEPVVNERKNFSGYKAANSIMGVVPYNNLPFVHEGKKFALSLLADDWYAPSYQRSLKWRNRVRGQESIFLDEE